MRIDLGFDPRDPMPGLTSEEKEALYDKLADIAKLRAKAFRDNAHRQVG